MWTMTLILTCLCAGSEAYPATSWSEAAQAFSAGPATPSLDLRTMLTRHIVERSCALLDETTARRRKALASGEWQAWRDGVRAAVEDPQVEGQHGQDEAGEGQVGPPIVNEGK